MSKTSVISCRVDEAMLATLDRLATAHDRSRAWVVNKLLVDAAAAELQLLEEIDEGIAAVDAGDFCTPEAFVERLAAILEEDRRAA